jgi:starch-binding outer membrane protein SusE/F
MKNFIKSVLAIFFVAFTISSCDKKNDLTNYTAGNASVLTASTATLAPAPADSSNVVLSFNWTNSNFAQDPTKHKYILEIDTAGRNFAKASTKTFTSVLKTSFTAKEVNAIALSYGFAFNVAYGMEARIVSSYANNNELFKSNVVKFQYTPYKIPPILALPTTSKLYITGGGTEFDWTNPSTMPAVRELTRIDETTWQGIFKMNSGGQYLLLPLAGSWADKFSVANNNLSGLANGGTFGFNFNDNFPTNFADGNGWYKMTYNFQNAKFTAIKESNPLGTDLFITGNATASDWTNAPPVSQKFVQKSNGIFEITVPFVPGKFFKFLNTNGQWAPQFGGNNSTGGDLGANYGSGQDPDAIPTPATAGTYKVTVNFHTKKYTVTQ